MNLGYPPVCRDQPRCVLLWRAWLIQHTVRRVDISHIGVVCCFPRPQGDAGGTAEGYGAVVAMKRSALICDVFLEMRHVGEGVHVQVLIIGQD